MFWDFDLLGLWGALAMAFSQKQSYPLTPVCCTNMAIFYVCHHRRKSETMHGIQGLAISPTSFPSSLTSHRSPQVQHYSYSLDDSLFPKTLRFSLLCFVPCFLHLVYFSSSPAQWIFYDPLNARANVISFPCEIIRNLSSLNWFLFPLCLLRRLPPNALVIFFLVL